MAQQIEDFYHAYHPEFLYLFTNFVPEDYIRVFLPELPVLSEIPAARCGRGPF